MLSPNHPLARHVRRTVTRILEANNLGRLKSPTMAVAPWSDASLFAGSGKKEWELMVVKDDQIVNAMASFGVSVRTITL